MRHGRIIVAAFTVLAFVLPALPEESTADRKKDKDNTADASGLQGVPNASHAGRKPDEPPFEEVIKDARRIEGLIKIYQKDDRYLMEVTPEQLERDYMLSVTRETGIGESFLLAAQVLGDGPVRFRRNGKRIQLIWRNPKASAIADPEMRRAVDRSFSESLQGSAKIESQPHPETKAILIDITPCFVTDYEGVGNILGQFYQSPYGLDRENSSISSVRGFPKNIEVGARLHFTGNKPAPFQGLVDDRSFFIEYRYSLTEIPAADDFVPRIADDRVGHFTSLFLDFSDDRRESPYVRYVQRWNLQKVEPYAAMSKPVEPIVFWLENSIPKQYRKAVADGILLWNTAFEKIGFTDALVVKQQPDDADWDAADVRYSTVRWFVATDSSFAIGPSRSNPYTGQIYDADIGVTESITRGARGEFRELADPVTALQRAFDDTLEPAPDRPGGRFADPRYLCSFSTGATRQAVFGHALLTARGMTPGSPEEDKYLNEFITHVIAHEVGHTLGLRHNFRASVVLPVDQLQDEPMTSRQGLTGSVMDYIPVNLAAPGARQGAYWQTHLGQYDIWAIRYAYEQFAGIRKPADELPELRKIAAAVAEAGNAYGTDEDTIDPRTSRWDIGTDPIAYYRQRTALSRELWKRIPGELSRPGEGYQAMRRSFAAGLAEFAPAVGNITKFVGGVYSNRDHVGDPNGRLPLQPVPAARQREALQFLRTELFSEASFAVPADLLTRLAPERWYDFGFSVFRMQRLEFPLHDAVLALQQAALNQLFRSASLDRLLDAEMMFAAGEKPFTLAEMFTGLNESIWSELYGTGAAKVDSFRRAVQREHLKKLVDLVVKPPSDAPEDAGTLARAALNELKGRIDAAMKNPAVDPATRAHMDETRARIEAGLSARMLRLQS